MHNYATRTEMSFAPGGTALARPSNTMVGIWDIARLVLAIFAMIIGPILIGILIGGIQLGFYKLLKKAGLIQEEDIPMFIILVMRGLFVPLAVIAIVVMYLKFGLGQPGFAPVNAKGASGPQSSPRFISPIFCPNA
jgi:hypothetical protein